MSIASFSNEGWSSESCKSYWLQVCGGLHRGGVYTLTERVSGTRIKRESGPALKGGTTLDSQRRRCTGGTLPLIFGL
jgi:hypothetical protein